MLTILLTGPFSSANAKDERSDRPASGEACKKDYAFRNVVIGGGGGFVPGIVFNTRQTNLVYARTDMGGAYRWNPGTGRWIPLLDWIGSDDSNLTGVESIATDPVDPQRLYLAVGTYTNEWTLQNGAILRSFDQGRTFHRADLPFKVGSNMPGRSMGERLAIDPNDNRILYLGTRSGNGLWRSHDEGRHWARVTTFPNPGTYFPSADDSYHADLIGVVWVTFDPRSGRSGGASNTIYVGVADLGTSVYRSTDGGRSWAAVPGQPTGFLPHHGKLASNGTLYLSYSNGAGPFDGTAGDVWKLDTARDTWTRITPVTGDAAVRGNALGFGGLSVDAHNPDTLMVAVLNSWPDTILFRSVDGGSSWTQSGYVDLDDWGQWSGGTWSWPPPYFSRYSLDYSAAPWLTFGAMASTCADTSSLNANCPRPTPMLGWMVGSLEIDPFDSNRMLYVTGATIFGTSNLASWDSGGKVQVSVNAVGIEETQVLDLVSPPAGPHLISAVGDIGGFTHNDFNLASVMHTNPVLTTSTSLDFAELKPSFVVRVGAGQGGGQNVGFSQDGGTTWSPAVRAPTGAVSGSVAAAADGSRVLWNPSGQGPIFSTDLGATWTASAGVAAGGRVAADRVNSMKFYALVDGTLYVSSDGGVNFQTAAKGLPPAAAHPQLKAVPGHDGDVWLAGGHTDSQMYGLWHSTDSGQSFRRAHHVGYADNIGFGKHAPSESYAALCSSGNINGVRGIHRSDDVGRTWRRINDDDHQYGSTSDAITGDPRIYGRVCFSTSGRGIICGDMDN